VRCILDQGGLYAAVQPQRRQHHFATAIDQHRQLIFDTMVVLAVMNVVQKLADRFAAANRLRVQSAVVLTGHAL
jgi:hypothetical protein